MPKLDILMTGVGGQGIILGSDIVCEAALASGLDTKKTDAIGMAQRGGSVVSHVRIGPVVRSPLIKEGMVDIIVAFEKLEAARWVSYLRPGGIALVNNQSIRPLSVNTGVECYPPDTAILGRLHERTPKVYLIDGLTVAKALGDTRILNIYLLGCLSVFTPFIKVHTWREKIGERVPPKAKAINLTAFARGRKEMDDVPA